MEFSELELAGDRRVDVPGVRGAITKGNRFTHANGYRLATDGHVVAIAWGNAIGDVGKPTIIPFAHVKRAVLDGELPSGAIASPLASVTLPVPVQDIVIRPNALGTRSFFRASDGYSLSFVNREHDAPFVVVQFGESKRLVIPLEQVSACVLAEAPAKARKAAA